MPAGASINQVTQVGVETTKGEEVVPTRRFQSLSLTKEPQSEFGSVRPQGAKYTTVNWQNREWTEYSVDDSILSFNEAVYPLASIMRKTTPELVAGATTANRWLFDSATFGRDDVQTYTFESGDVQRNRGGKASFGVFTEWGFEVNRTGDSAEMSGSAMARALDASGMTQDGITEAEVIPIIPGQFNIYKDDTAAALGTTKIDTAFAGGFTLGDRQAPVWYLNRAFNSFAEIVESEPSTELTLTLSDEEGPLDDILQGLRKGDKFFIRLEAIGPVIETTPDTADDTTGTVTPGEDIPYSFVLDIAAQVSDNPSYDSEESAQAVSLTLSAVHDQTWGKAFQAEVVNADSAL